MNCLLKKFTLLSILLLVGMFSHASVIPCRTYDVRNGLSENSVRCIMQDRTGYMWFGTKDGLCCYNGNSFIVYGSSVRENPDDIQLVQILDIIQHKDGKKIWIASRKLNMLDPESGKLEEIRIKGYDDREGYRNLCYDGKGRLWVGGNDGIAVLYGHENEVVMRFSVQNGKLSDNNITDIFCSHDGAIWVGTEKGLLRYDTESDSFVSYDTEDNITCISEDENSIIWVGTWDSGMASLNPKSGKLNHLFSDSTPTELPRIRYLFHKDNSTITICSDIGLFEFNHSTSSLRRLSLSSGVENDSYYFCMTDNEGGLWIGSYFNGVNYISPKAQKIEYYKPSSSGEFTGTAVSQFCQGRGNSLWVATENGGLNLLDTESRKFLPISWHKENENIHALCQVGRHLWVGTFSDGLKRINLSTGKTEDMELPGEPQFSDKCIYSLCWSSNSTLYIGTMNGCYTFDYTTEKFSSVDELKGRFIYDICEDYTGRIWFGTARDGLYCHDRSSDGWTRYDAFTTVSKLYCDSKSRFWVCTVGDGIYRYDYEADSFSKPRVKSENSQLPCNIIMGVLDDSEGRLWLSSNRGLIRLDPLSGEYRLYTYEDGLQSNQFNFRSSFKDRNGKFWFGGINGFNSFYPNDIKDNTVPPTIVTSLHYAGFSQRISSHSKITIPPPSQISVFSIEFDCLSYAAPEKNTFEYKFSNDREWTRTTQNMVQFANMNSGHHTLTVRAINADGYTSENECTIELFIKPVFWKSPAAYIIYLILFLTASIVAMTYIIKVRKRNEKRRLDEIRLRSEQKSYNAKIMFFTQIAHEIRTPVTLIKAPLELIMERNVEDEVTAENLQLINANTERLLKLIDQLLDFKKISNEGYRLNIEDSDFVCVVGELAAQFRKSEKSGIDISFRSSDSSIEGSFDPEAVTKIVSNMIANAIKYTKDIISIELSKIEENGMAKVHISVSDNGPGVAPEDADSIFEAFYQADRNNNEHKPGFGIGLSLVKLLVEKHKGEVYVNKHYSPGCQICVDLPLHSGEKTAVKQEQEETQASNTSNRVSDVCVLIVEDNAEILDFLANSFGANYSVLTAKDGKAALKKLQQSRVDCIISDIAMPNMDGFQLLKAVRENQMLCHIPFVLLSAETSIDSKIKGLDIGADAYIEKPFSIRHFTAVVDNLLMSRRMLIEKFTKDPLGGHDWSNYGSINAEWLNRLDNIINENISESDFSVQDLADKMFISRSNLQRKLQGLINMSPNEYIRIIRLKKAAQLLSEGNWRINEVCYMVGFNNPSYFSTSFQNQFGILPKNFANQHKKGQP